MIHVASFFFQKNQTFRYKNLYIKVCHVEMLSSGFEKLAEACLSYDIFHDSL